MYKLVRGFGEAGLGYLSAKISEALNGTDTVNPVPSLCHDLSTLPDSWGSKASKEGRNVPP